MSAQDTAAARIAAIEKLFEGHTDRRGECAEAKKLFDPMRTARSGDRPDHVQRRIASDWESSASE